MLKNMVGGDTVPTIDCKLKLYIAKHEYYINDEKEKKTLYWVLSVYRRLCFKSKHYDTIKEC